jgi:hypothetical protein
MKYLLGLIVFGFCIAFAQPTMTKTLDQYQPVLELMNTVNIATQIDAMPGLEFGKTQIKPLLEWLRGLSATAKLEPDAAQLMLKNLETKILTPAQLKALVQKRLELKALAQKRRTQVRVSEGGSSALNLYSLTVPGARAFITILEKGESVNPFRLDPNLGILKKFVGTLETR